MQRWWRYTPNNQRWWVIWTIDNHDDENLDGHTGGNLDENGEETDDAAEVEVIREMTVKSIGKIVLSNANNGNQIWGVAAGLADALWYLGIREGIRYDLISETC